MCKQIILTFQKAALQAPIVSLSTMPFLSHDFDSLYVGAVEVLVVDTGTLPATGPRSKVTMGNPHTTTMHSSTEITHVQFYNQ